MELIGIKTPRGLYLSDDNDVREKWSTSRSLLGSCIVNGQKVKPTFHKHWHFAEGAQTIEAFTKMENQPRINHRFELIDPSFANDKVPLVIPRGEAGETEDYEFHWFTKYKHLASLYELKSDEQPNAEVAVPFALEIVLELEEDLIDYGSFRYPRPKKWRKDPQFYVTNDEAQHRALDGIVFPSLLLSFCPCRLTSRESYDVVREHVKRNYNKDVADVTSDYDFCFTVKKRIVLAEPYQYKKEVKNARGKSYKKRRYRTIYVADRSMEVFEMTCRDDNRRSITPYRGYTIIGGFEGKDEQDLQDNINAYLAELMDIINAPLVECSHCNGMGVIWDGKKFATNGGDDG